MRADAISGLPALARGARRLPLLAALLVLAGCGGNAMLSTPMPLTPIDCTSCGEFAAMRAYVSPPEPVAQYQALAAAGAPAMQARSEASGERMVLRRMARSADGTVTWLAPDGTGFSFRGAILVATRGADGDLMSADVTQIQAALNQGGGNADKRFHSYLDGNNQTVLRSYVCDVAPAQTPSGGRVMQEDCVGASERFINTYPSATAAGTGAGTRQRVSAEAGYFIFGQGA